MAAARAARANKQAGAPQGLATTASFIPPVSPANAGDEDMAARAALQAAERKMAETPVSEEGMTEAQRKTNNERVAEKLAAEAAVKLEAARTLAANGGVVPVSNLVKVRVTKLGDGRVSMGQHFAGLGDAYYKRGEEPSFAADIASRLDDAGYVELI
jgi:hypothetical protein